MDQQIAGKPTFAGTDVTETTALNLSAVWNATTIISGTVASLPLILYKRTGSNKTRAKNHPLFNVLHNQANPEMTSFIWRETAQQHILLWGNHYSLIKRNEVYDVVELWPLNPSRMEVERENGRIIYKLRKDDGTKVVFRAEDIFHIPGLGFDGRLGYSVISNMARQSLGTSLAADEHAGRVFAQGTTLRGYLTHPGRFGGQDREGAATKLRNSWEQAYGGLSHAGKIAILEEGMEFKPLSMSPEDLQLLTTRVFNVSEVSRWFNIQLHKLKELTRATFSNIEQQQLEFVIDTMRPWFVRWEAHIDWKLLNEDERDVYFAEFLMDALLRGDAKSRNEAYAIQRLHGILNADEWRSYENMNKIGGKAGEAYLWQLNMKEAGEEAPTSLPGASPPLTKVPPPKKEQKTSDLVDVRIIRSITERKRVSREHRTLFYNAVKRILEEDNPRVRVIAKSLTTRDIIDYNEQIDEYFNGRYAAYRREFSGPYMALGSAIYPIAADEVKANEKPDAQYDQYLDEFIATVSLRYVNTSRNQLKQVARRAEAEGSDPVEAVEERLDEWDQKRPAQIADREIVDGENGLAQFVFFSNGFRSRWVAVGSSCPYCSALDGKIVGRGGAFLEAGSAFEPAGALNGPLSPSIAIKHPQAHRGCDCSIIATL